MSISSSAVLVDLNISVWPASKVDREVTDMVNNSANAVTGAAQTKKNLFAGTSLRKDIEKFAARVRLYHNVTTLPWADKGERLLPTRLFMEYKQEMNKFQAQFHAMCKAFFDNYDNLVAEAPLHLGSLYKAEDYPARCEVEDKFGFRLNIKPLPEAGDFRLDIPSADLESLRTQYEQQYETKLQEAMKSAWTRLYDMLKGMSEKLTDNDDGTNKRFHDTFVSNATDLCDLLKKLNVTNDPDLERARTELEQVMKGVDITTIKDSELARSTTKQKVDDILSKFNW